jgi:cellulose biosynthesis protein BcsQ
MANITIPMKQYMTENPGLKYVFFGGKGGVGKTVLAGTAAIWNAQQGKRTLLASTNPVHSLSSLLDQDVFGSYPGEGRGATVLTRSTPKIRLKSPSRRSARRSSGS